MPAAPSRHRALGVVAALAVGAFALAACGGGSGGSTGPTWTPKPSFTEGNLPPSQDPAQPGEPSTGPSTSHSPGAEKSSPVVATHLVAPTGLTIMPDNSALVGERTTGRIVRVQPRSGQPTPTVRVIRGLSTVGGGGLLDLAISPNYTQDNLIFAYITTAKDNRVIAFTLTGPATPVLTGIPRGRTDNAGRIAFSADGDLLVATGDAGHPALAADPHSLAGKVLRVTDIGRPATGNPTKGSPVYASGFRLTSGLCVTSSQLTFQVGYRPDASRDPVYAVAKGGRYGWPTAANTDVQPIGQLPTTARAPGGCAVLNGVLFATSLNGKALLSATLKPLPSGARALGVPNTVIRNKYGRLRTVVAAPDGALWLTTSNRDGSGTPVAADERVIRIVPSAAGGGNSPL